LGSFKSFAFVGPKEGRRCQFVRVCCTFVTPKIASGMGLTKALLLSAPYPHKDKVFVSEMLEGDIRGCCQYVKGARLRV